MATNKFLEFDSNKLNIQSDATYAADSQRINGVGGIARKEVHNKLFRQASVMAAAIGEVIKDAGYDATDDSVATLKGNITNSIATRPYVDTQLATKANESDLVIERERIDLLKTSAGDYYIKCLSTDTGALLVVASGATTGQINLSNVTPKLDTYTPISGDYVRLVSNGLTSETIDIRIGSDGVVYSSAGNAVRGQANKLNDSILSFKDNQNINIINTIDWNEILHQTYISSAWSGAYNDGYWSVHIPVKPNTQYVVWNSSSNVTVNIPILNYYQVQGGLRIGYATLVKSFTTPSNCYFVSLSFRYTASGVLTTYSNGIAIHGAWYDDNIGVLVCNVGTESNIQNPYNTYLNDNIAVPKYYSQVTGRLVHIKDGVRGSAKIRLSRADFSGTINIITSGSNIYDGILRTGYYVNGVYTSNSAAWCNTNPIRVNSTDWIICSKQVRITEYDKNGNAIRMDLCDARKPYKTSYGCSYINWHSGVQSDALAMYINVGRVLTDVKESYTENITSETVRAVGTPGTTKYDIEIQLLDGINNIWINSDSTNTITLIYASDTKISSNDINGILKKITEPNYNRHKAFGIIPCAHRGNSYYLPENTVYAYTAAFLQGFECCESDVRWSSDGIPVILHDPSIDRTSNGTGNIAEMTLSDANAFDYGTWFNKNTPTSGITQFKTFIEMCAKLGMTACMDIRIAEAMTTDQINSLWLYIQKWNMQEHVIWICSNMASFHLIGALYQGTNYKAKICWQQWQGGTTSDIISGITSIAWFKNHYPVSEAYSSIVYTEINDTVNQVALDNGIYIMSYFSDSQTSINAITSYPAIKILTTNSMDINKAICNYYANVSVVENALDMIS